MTGLRLRSVRFKDGHTVDGLGEAFASIGNGFNSRIGPLMGGASLLPGIFTHQLALAAYMASGMMRKVISIPAEDRVREWRDWQADGDDITAIEAEEKRLELAAKAQEAELLRGIGGGALIIITAGNHSDELKAEAIGTGGIVAVNVVSRWEIRAKGWEKNLASPRYRQPTMWQIDGENGHSDDIHPSRVICFRGARLPAGATLSDEDRFWGDSRLLRVYNEVARSDQAQAWFAELIRKAKLLRIGIPDLLDMMSSEAGRSQLNKRVSLIATGESVLNATVYRSGTGTDDPGEKIEDYQINWTGIPAMMDAFDQRVSAVGEVPFTILMGRSPAGMNATGDHDRQNWNRTVKKGQEGETRPCLEALDPILLRSAGVTKPGIWWQFAPLDVPTEKEDADTFKTTMDAVEKVQNSGAIPERAFAEGFQNLMTERGWMPGLEDALKKIPEAERFGISGDDNGGDDDPSAIQAGGGDPGNLAGRGGNADPNPARRAVAANDAAVFFADAQPRPLYVQRKLLNAASLIAWAKANGFKSTLPADDMHVTVLYSKTAVDPMKMGEGWSGDENGNVRVKPGGPRAIERLGPSAVVLLFASWDIEGRHRSMIEAGGSHDFDSYQPHVTLSYEVPEGVDLEAIKPYTGALEFGPELFEPLDLDWKSKVGEA
jgi:phage-related protein (TIGR01555 family)